MPNLCDPVWCTDIQGTELRKHLGISVTASLFDESDSVHCQNCRFKPIKHHWCCFAQMGKAGFFFPIYTTLCSSTISLRWLKCFGKQVMLGEQWFYFHKSTWISHLDECLIKHQMLCLPQRFFLEQLWQGFWHWCCLNKKHFLVLSKALKTPPQMTDRVLMRNMWRAQLP